MGLDIDFRAMSQQEFDYRDVTASRRHVQRCPTLRIASIDLNAFDKQRLHLLDVPPLGGAQQRLPGAQS
jgi:hypothetical protein